ncbi:MAG: hypothetical protein M5R36_21400 [Deltaproteobacteria bacterium]|nr:hypothetical protein [Deltaproteobacteria bacterium]
MRRTSSSTCAFRGSNFDEESDLHYNWHRYYEPVTGRYLQPAPIFNNQPAFSNIEQTLKERMSPYGYSWSSPFLCYDLFGTGSPKMGSGGDEDGKTAAEKIAQQCIGIAYGVPPCDKPWSSGSVYIEAALCCGQYNLNTWQIEICAEIVDSHVKSWWEKKCKNGKCQDLL